MCVTDVTTPSAESVLASVRMVKDNDQGWQWAVAEMEKGDS